MSVDPYNRDPYTTTVMDDDDGVIWDYHDRALARERAAMLRAVSEPVAMERIRPAVRDDLTAARGFLIGFVLAAGFWAMFLVVAYAVTS